MPPHSNPSTETLKAGLLQALAEFSSEKGEELTSKIRGIALINLNTGRYHHYLLKNDQASLFAYVCHIAEGYQKLHPYVYQVQQEKPQEVWTPLYEKLQKWAYNFLLKQNFSPSQRTYQTAIDYAGHAAQVILQAHFPYDSDFDAWAHAIANNICRNEIRAATQKSKIPDAAIVSLDALLVEPMAGPDREQEAARMLSLDMPVALEKLTARRRCLILLYYYEGLSFPEIAKELHISPNAVHKLHFDAIDALRKFLDV